MLLKLVKERNMHIESTIADVNAHFGSVQHVDWLTDEEKMVFKTAFEINQHAVIRHASMRAKFLDQWQSVNLFHSADAPEEYISAVHKAAFLDENIIGLYYLYTLAGVSASDGNECVACQ